MYAYAYYMQFTVTVVIYVTLVCLLYKNPNFLSFLPVNII